ncbi:hypothetical protein BX600DRAFT_504646 [Xylariales sp. PMI_506]|nr:hypothetical protein BX600DRAFT_504646 [Xylariales sp. PMI_506]
MSLLRFKSLESLRKSVINFAPDIQPPPLPLRRSQTSSIALSSSSSSTYSDSASSSSTDLSQVSCLSFTESDIQIQNLSTEASDLKSRRNSTFDKPMNSNIAAMDGGRPTEDVGSVGNRLQSTFNASSYDAVNRRCSPSGVKWRYARQGAHLTSTASVETEDADFERRSYIDGVAYFLRACPDNLTDLETDILLRSAPWLAATQLRPPSEIAIAHPAGRRRTFLHRSVQYIVSCAVVLLHALWCFLLVAGRIGARYERQYNVSEWIAANGFEVANALGRHSVVLSERIGAMGEGRLGQALSGLCAWAVDSLTGGIQDGYGDGMMRVRRKTHQGHATMLKINRTYG